jgi:glycosyltransferase involved in cell wall biosynthesis
MLASGAMVVRRGIGRYTLGQLREVLRAPGAQHHEFVLMVPEGALAQPLLAEMTSAPNVSIACVSDPLLLQDGGARQRLFQASVLSALAAELRLDLLHVTAPLLSSVPGFWRCDSCALVATHYDLIPLLYPGHYASYLETEGYLTSVQVLSWADRLLAVSHCVADEATRQLGIERDRIDVAYPAANPCFASINPGEAAQRISSLEARLGRRLPPGFLLTVSHLHHTKNLPTLLQGFGMMPDAWRRLHPLVIVGDYDRESRERLDAMALAVGVQGEIIVPGSIDDADLAALYCLCHLCLVPSRYEGFGLPALEAMSAGAPVIAGSGGALPEVVGRAGVLVDPEDPGAFSRAIEELDRDPDRRRLLRGLGPENASRFTAERWGEATLQCYVRAVSDRLLSDRRRDERPRLALFSPFPPLPSGVSDYAAELVPELLRAADVEAFVDDAYLPSADVLQTLPVFHYTAFERRNLRQRFDLVIYQLGGSEYHLYMLEAIQRWPGLLVLHDLTLGYLYLDLFAAGWPLPDVERELIQAAGLAARHEYAAIARMADDDPVAAHAAGEAFLGRHFMLRSLVASSRAELVHFPRGGDDLVRLYPEARVIRFPMGVEDPRLSAPVMDRSGLRRRYGLSADAFIVGAFGIVDPVKRIEAVIRALGLLSEELPEAQLIVVGRFSGEAYRCALLELAAELGVGDRVRFFDQVAKDDFHRLLLACDAVVGLRFPFRKQMSAALLRAIAAGRPVAITEIPDWDHLPESFCARIAPDGEESTHLARWMSDLAADPDAAEARGQLAREYFLEQGTLREMARNYLSVARDLKG